MKEIQAKRAEIQAMLERGFPVVPIQPGGKAALIPYTAYEATVPSMKRWDGWLSSWPSCNLGIVTGGKYAALDFDVEDVSGFPAGLFHTTVIKTPRPGWKSLYTLEGPIKSATLSLPGGPVEVFGAGKFALIPPSIHPSGKAYEYVTSWDDIAPFPTELDVAAKVESGGFYRLIHWAGQFLKADCARQLLKHDLKGGERNRALFTLAVLLKQANINQETAAKVVLAKYQHGIADKAGLDAGEVLGIVASVYTGAKGSYRLSCDGVRQRHSWMDCSACVFLKRRVAKMTNEGGFLWKVTEVFKGDTETQTVALALVVSGDWEARTLNDSQLAERTGLDRRTVRTRLAKLEDAGLLPGEVPSLKLL